MKIHFFDISLTEFFFAGIRILYTDKLRQYDTAMLLVGSEVNFLHMMPPKQQAFKTLGRCTSDCTKEVKLQSLLGI